ERPARHRERETTRRQIADREPAVVVRDGAPIGPESFARQRDDRATDWSCLIAVGDDHARDGSRAGRGPDVRIARRGLPGADLRDERGRENDDADHLTLTVLTARSTDFWSPHLTETRVASGSAAARNFASVHMSICDRSTAT